MTIFFQISDVSDGLGAEPARTSELAGQLEATTIEMISREPEEFDFLYQFVSDVLELTTNLSQLHSHFEEPPLVSEIEASSYL